MARQTNLAFDVATGKIGSKQKAALYFFYTIRAVAGRKETGHLAEATFFLRKEVRTVLATTPSRA